MTYDRDEITLPPGLISRSLAFGRRAVRGYELGEKSTAASMNGAQFDVELHAGSRMAECAFCLWLGVDPVCRLDWGHRPDDGKDLELMGLRFDVKHTGMHSQFLIWPLSKNKDYPKKQFDILVLVKSAFPLFRVSGWVTKKRFSDEHRVALPGHRLIEGTWYMHESRLEKPFALDELWAAA